MLAKSVLKRALPETLAPPIIMKPTGMSTMGGASSLETNNNTDEKMSKLKELFVKQTDDFSVKALLRNAAINKKINENRTMTIFGQQATEAILMIRDQQNVAVNEEAEQQVLALKD